jgi:hypothetical protein
MAELPHMISFNKEIMIPDEIHQGNPCKTRLKLYQTIQYQIKLYGLYDIVP